MASSPASNLASLPGESQGSSSSSSSSSKGSFQKYLTNCKSLYSCIYCRTHLANHDELVSRSFQGNHGRAYLFKSVINVSCGPAVQRDLNTGPHAVADIFCSDCERTLGWKYEKAYVESQKYKEGKYIIELAHVVRENRHLELDKGEMYFSKRDKHRSSSSNFQNISSKLPPSPTNCSPTSRYFKEGGETRVVADDDNDDDDEELMFPFYEDLLACQSSSVSLSHHQRLRRSLYLDSTPYDWKYSTSSASSPRQSSEVGTKIASSLDSGSDLSPSKSSSSDNSLDNRQMSYHISGSSGVSSSSSSSNKNLVDTTKGADSLASRYQNQRVRNTRSECDNNNNNNNNSSNNNEEDIAAEDDINENYDENDDDGTQFRFEEDKPNSNLSNDTQTNKMQCDHIISDDSVIIAQCSSNSQIERTSMNNRKDVNELASRESENDISDAEMSSSGRDPIVLDDETFYDCCTDHAITNSISESSSTLEQ